MSDRNLTPEEFEIIFRKRLNDMGYVASDWRVGRQYETCALQVPGHQGRLLAKLFVDPSASLYGHNELHMLNRLGPGKPLLPGHEYPMYVPRVHMSGGYEGCPWYILEPYYDLTLESARLSDPRNYKPLLDALAELAVRFLGLDTSIPTPVDIDDPVSRDDNGIEYFFLSVERKSKALSTPLVRQLNQLVDPLRSCSVYLPAHGNLFLDSIGVSGDNDSPPGTFLVFDWQRGRTQDVVFWDAATLYADIYLRWGAEAATDFRNLVIAKLGNKHWDCFLKYFPGVCAAVLISTLYVRAQQGESPSEDHLALAHSLLREGVA